MNFAAGVRLKPNDVFDLSNTGTYHLQGLVWICENIGESTKVYSKDVIAESIITFSKEQSLADLIQTALELANPQLRPYLTRKGIKQWLPMRNPSFDYIEKEDKTVFEICYYHDHGLHKKLEETFKVEDETFVWNPSEKLINDLSLIYDGYGVTFMSESIRGDEKSEDWNKEPIN